MATTPEGKVKKHIREFLDKFGDDCYRYMPVPGGYGAAGLDFHCVIKGRAFFIEAKAKDGKLTARQYTTQRIMKNAGAPVFIVKSKEDLVPVEEWICKVLLSG
jgi:hypothetical protein